MKEKRYDLDYNWWHIHEGARKAVSTLLELPNTSFKFLDYPLMPKITNEIEVQFGHLGKRWLAHRGLKKNAGNIFLNGLSIFTIRKNYPRGKQKRTKKSTRNVN